MLCGKEPYALRVRPVMPAEMKNDARLNFRLPSDLKAIIEEAAATLGQSVSDFAVSTLVQSARSVLCEQSVTELTNRDRDIFVALLDDAEAKPNRALSDAAKTDIGLVVTFGGIGLLVTVIIIVIAIQISGERRQNRQYRERLLDR